MRTPSAYETEARRQIQLWKNPSLGWLDQAMRTLNWPLDKAGDLVMKTPGIGWVLEKSVGGLVTVTNDVAQLSVRPDAIHEENRRSGHPVSHPGDIIHLDLSD